MNIFLLEQKSRTYGKKIDSRILLQTDTSIGVRVVKEVDLSPTGVMPRRFESCPMHQGSIAQSVERVAVNH